MLGIPINNIFPGIYGTDSLLANRNALAVLLNGRRVLLTLHLVSPSDEANSSCETRLVDRPDCPFSVEPDPMMLPRLCYSPRLVRGVPLLPLPLFCNVARPCCGF